MPRQEFSPIPPAHIIDEENRRKKEEERRRREEERRRPSIEIPIPQEDPNRKTPEKNPDNGTVIIINPDGTEEKR